MSDATEDFFGAINEAMPDHRLKLISEARERNTEIAAKRTRQHKDRYVDKRRNVPREHLGGYTAMQAFKLRHKIWVAMAKELIKRHQHEFDYLYREALYEAGVPLMRSRMQGPGNQVIVPAYDREAAARCQHRPVKYPYGLFCEICDSKLN